MQVTKNYNKGEWVKGNGPFIISDLDSEDRIEGSDQTTYYGGYLIAESVTDANALLISAAPDLVEALIEMCKMAHAFNDQTGTVDNTWEESQQQAEECWDEMLDGSSKAAIKTRAALIKAGVITE